MPNDIDDIKLRCVLGFMALIILCSVSLGVNVRLFLDHDKEQVDELAQCIVLGVAIPVFLGITAYIDNLKLTTPAWHAQLILGVDALFGLSAATFAILAGVQSIQGTGPPRTNLNTVLTFLNSAEALLAAWMTRPTAKLMTTLKEHQKVPNTVCRVEQGFGIPETKGVSHAPVSGEAASHSYLKQPGQELRELRSSSPQQSTDQVIQKVQ